MACPNFMEKTFVGGSKTVKFVKVFSLKNFPLYGMTQNRTHPEYSRGVYNYQNATPALSLSERGQKKYPVASEIAQHHASNMHIQLNNKAPDNP